MTMSFVIVCWASTWIESWFGLVLFFMINIFVVDFLFIIFVDDIFHESEVLCLN